MSENILKRVEKSHHLWLISEKRISQHFERYWRNGRGKATAVQGKKTRPAERKPGWWEHKPVHLNAPQFAPSRNRDTPVAEEQAAYTETGVPLGASASKLNCSASE